MAYIRNFQQADWFFNTGQVPGGLEPTGAAAPALPGAPAQAPIAPEEVEEVDVDEEVEVPVLESKKSPVGLYILGGVGVLVLGIFLYKKFTKETEEVVSAPALGLTSQENLPAVVASRRKKKRK